MPAPYEDPRKAELRRRSREAIDRAGYAVLDVPEGLALPEHLQLKGKLLGDLQADSSDGTRHVYFFRGDGSRPIPQWIASYAAAGREMGSVRVYVIAEEVSETLQTSCRAAGAGLLLITTEDELQQIVDPDEFSQQQRREKISKEARDLRRRFDTKIRLETERLDKDFADATHLTQGMPENRREAYLEVIEKAQVELREWQETVSTRLDGVIASLDEKELRAIEQTIENGPAGETEASA